MGHGPPRSHVSRRVFIATGAAGALGLLGCADGAAKRSATLAGDGADSLPEPDAAPDSVGLDTGFDPDAADGAEVTELADSDPGPDASPSARFDPRAISDASQAVFPIGVGATEPVVGGAILSTRYLGTGALECVVWRTDSAEPDGPLVLRQGLATAEGGFAQLDVSGLAPSAEHRFAFVGPEGKGPVGRFRSPPEADAKPVVVLGASSCAKWNYRPFDVLTHAADADLDLFLLLGDTTYADDATTLDEYRANWTRNLDTAEYRALRSSTMCAATWDDHEVANNWDPETFDPERLAAARQAFFEHMAPRRTPGVPERIWRSLRWGATVEVFILDCRSERRPSTRDGASAEYISPAQLDWLETSLAASTAVFKLIVSSVPVTRWPLLYLASDQRWQGYAAQRERVLALVANIPGALWLAGDFHFGAVAHVDPPGYPHADQLEILVGPIGHINPALAIVQATGSPEQFPFLSGERNFGRFTLDPGASPPRITIEHVGSAGQVLSTFVFEV